MFFFFFYYYKTLLSSSFDFPSTNSLGVWVSMCNLFSYTPTQDYITVENEEEQTMREPETQASDTLTGWAGEVGSRCLKEEA